MFENVPVGVDRRPNGRDEITLATRLDEADGKLTLAHVHHGEAREDLEDSHKLLEAEREAVELQLEVAAAAGKV